MALVLSEIRGKPSLVFLKYLGTSKTEPVDKTITVATAGATAGDLDIPIDDPTVDIPKNTILTFDPSGAAVKVVVTADFSSGAGGDLAVQAFEGAPGTGISADLADDDTATWDQLYTDFASENFDFSRNPSTQSLSAVTHGSGSDINVAQTEVTEIAPSISRTGLLAKGQLLEDILTYGDTNGYWWVKIIFPDENGAAWITMENYAKILNVGIQAPAGDLIRLPYTIQFQANPVPTFA